MPSTSRDLILSDVRKNLPAAKTALPEVPTFPGSGAPLLAAFEASLTRAGGASYTVANAAEVQAKLGELHPSARVICSAVPEIPGTKRIETICDARELADVDVGVVRAQFGVAETGAVWLTEEELVVPALGVLSQHLVILLDPRDLVPTMQEAYDRIRLDRTAYGCFMMGPSATADVEMVLVHGAQGARSLAVLFLARS